MPDRKFILWREKRVVLALVRGSWSRLTAEDYSRQFKHLAEPLIGEPWAHIIYLDDWQLGVPEIEPVVQELVQWCIDGKLQYAAQVYSPSMIKKYQLDRMISDSIHEFEKRVYPNEQDAFNWLDSLEFQTDSTSVLKQALQKQ